MCLCKCVLPYVHVCINKHYVQRVYTLYACKGLRVVAYPRPLTQTPTHSTLEMESTSLVIYQGSRAVVSLPWKLSPGYLKKYLECRAEERQSNYSR